MDSSPVLLRSLLIALVVVTPYGVHKLRQVRARRALAARPPGSGTIGTDPSVTPVAAAPRLEDVVARIEAVAGSLDPGDPTTVTVPSGVTVGGDEVPTELVDSLVRDALRRSGLVATAEVDTADGRLLECRRA